MIFLMWIYCVPIQKKNGWRVGCHVMLMSAWCSIGKVVLGLGIILLSELNLWCIGNLY